VRAYLAIMAIALLAATTLAAAATNSTNTMATSANVPTFILFNTTTATINSTTGGVLFTKSPKGFNMSLLILPGTYANVSNVIYPAYNVTLSTFKVTNVPAPPDAPNDTPRSAFLFRINNRIIQAVAFVNSSGAPHPVTFVVNHLDNWTSYSYMNETVNGTGYVGGTYGKQNKWSYNATTTTMSDVTLERAQMHVYELMPGPASDYVSVTTSTVATTVPTTTVATTVATTTILPAHSTLSGNRIAVMGSIIIIIIVIIAAAMMMKKKPKK